MARIRSWTTSPGEPVTGGSNRDGYGAHNEQERLPACLAALGNATVIVVADACTDQTAEVARQRGAVVLEVTERNVGAARAAGVRELLKRGVSWVATTDADTLVPAGWLKTQLRLAAGGWDAVAGTVSVTDWTGHPPWRPAVFAQHYARHAPIHGANLGFTAEAYRTAGGFPALPTGEDHALVDAMERAGRRVLRTPEVNVITSARLRYRAPRGFGHLISTLEL